MKFWVWTGCHNTACHWQLKTISFETAGKTVRLQGVKTTDLPRIPESDAYELQRMQIANDIWTAALVTVSRALYHHGGSTTTVSTWSWAQHPSTPSRTATHPHIRTKLKNKFRICCSLV